MKLYLISLFILAVASCNTNKNTVEPQKIEAEAAAEVVVAEVEELPTCLDEYADIGDVLAETGRVVRVGDKLMIAYGTSSRANPCNLPADYSNGDEVKFSGKVKASPEGVRLSGTPFMLTIIEKI